MFRVPTLVGFSRRERTPLEVGSRGVKVGYLLAVSAAVQVPKDSTRRLTGSTRRPTGPARRVSRPARRMTGHLEGLAGAMRRVTETVRSVPGSVRRVTGSVRGITEAVRKVTVATRKGTPPVRRVTFMRLEWSKSTKSLGNLRLDTAKQGLGTNLGVFW